MKQLTNLYDQPEIRSDKELVILGLARDLVEGFYNGVYDAVIYSIDKIYQVTIDREMELSLTIKPSSSLHSENDHHLARVELLLEVKQSRPSVNDGIRMNLDTEGWFHRDFYRNLSALSFIEAPVVMNRQGVQLRLENVYRKVGKNQPLVRSYSITDGALTYKRVHNADAKDSVIRNLSVEMAQLTETEQKRLMVFLMENIDEKNPPTASFLTEEKDSLAEITGGLDLSEDFEEYSPRRLVAYQVHGCPHHLVVGDYDGYIRYK